MTDALAAGIDALGLGLDASAQGQLRAYVALLAKWNATHNLTAIRDPESMMTHHLLDSLAVLAYLPMRETLSVADVGSGGGLPGIPLAVARPRWRFTLIDSSRKKTAFLAQAAIETGLPNVEVVCTRVEAYSPRTRFDIVIARAYAATADFVSQARHLLAPHGRFIAMKGLLPHDEIARLPADIRVIETPRLAIPGVDAARHLVVMEVAA